MPAPDQMKWARKTLKYTPFTDLLLYARHGPTVSFMEQGWLEQMPTQWSQSAIWIEGDIRVAGVSTPFSKKFRGPRRQAKAENVKEKRDS